MGRPKFDSPLVLVEQYDPDTGDTGVSPVATGPIDSGPIVSGDVIRWMAVWIFQSPKEGTAAAASGRSAYEESIKTKWELDTFLVKGSDDFSTDKPAVAMALAQIWPGGDVKRREFYWWLEPVMLVKESG
jgi:hypothetical protein